MMDKVPGREDGVSRLLSAAILKLKTEEEVHRFFNDLCTINEINAMAQRIDIAKLLHENVTFAAIASQTGASTATISRVNRSLNYGTGGYKMILERLEKE